MTRDFVAHAARQREREYNYRRFRLSHFQWDPMPGPRPGEQVPDFAIRRLDGGELRLSELAGRTVVVEAGSYTCPQFVANVERMASLRRRFPEVEFLVLYNREAHPGGRVGPHRSLQAKMELARRTRQREGDERTYLVDDLDGRVSLALGGMANFTYVMDGLGRVVYRSLFTWPPEVEKVLAEMEAGTARPRNGYGFIPAARHLVPVFLRGGWGAVWDFAVALPGTMLFHLRMVQVQREWSRDAQADPGGLPELA